MEKLVNHIYRKILAANPFYGILPVEDVKQEIRIAILSSDPNENIKAAARNIYALATSLGYSRKMGKDKFGFKDTTLTEEQQLMLLQIEAIYQENTAKKTCEILKVEYTSRIQKLLHQTFPKSMGWGGARR